ncbi:unnamed protein product [Aureobasidium mustum]|uniref:Uncharacterized protein n=1 Tax=Aureobasidium mustum TaxID=2773714 RepID=A0A9N8PKS2_9PEZI|nr:unnamed protein product [Aureobasidium mustum]
MDLPDSMLLLEPLHCTAEEILQGGARNPAAVHRYLDCLSRGWLGQALIERYTYGEPPSAPAGMLQTNRIRNGRLVEWLKPIEDQIKDDLSDLLKGGNIEDLVAEMHVYAKAMDNLDDPGRKLSRDLVVMLQLGLDVL